MCDTNSPYKIHEIYHLKKRKKSNSRLYPSEIPNIIPILELQDLPDKETHVWRTRTIGTQVYPKDLEESNQIHSLPSLNEKKT